MDFGAASLWLAVELEPIQLAPKLCSSLTVAASLFAK